MKKVQLEFGYKCQAVDGIESSIASVNEFFGMTENYSIGLQIMSIGRRSITRATVV